mgnify:CR=1 FL=1
MALGFYELRAEALPVAREALDKLNKRAAKNSLEAITLRVLDTRTAEHQRVGEAPEVVTWVTVSIEGIAPKLGDWQFAVGRPAPAPGEHGAEVLAEAGFSAGEIAVRDGYGPGGRDLFRAMAYWAKQAGCEHMLEYKKK